MIPAALIDLQHPATVQASEDAHILVVATQGAARYAVASQLLDAGLCVTTASSFGVVEILTGADAFDAMIVVQTADQIAQFGVAQLARSMHPDLPIVVLEAEAAVGPGILGLVQTALARWPLRDFAERQLH